VAETKTIEILKDTNCDRKRVKAGDIVEASTKDAKFLINTKKAVLSEGKAKRGRKSPVNRMIDPEELENRDAGE
jgi:hypothetical protein